MRGIALREIEATRWVPAAGENRITGMIESRPDWVISRQRAWGVPIAVFVREKADGSAEILMDEAVNKRIADAFEQEGADAWYQAGARERFLGSRANEDWNKVDDICDVWFDSGSTHAFVLDDPKDFPASPASSASTTAGPTRVMYLEGSDQHRGWFHSSLLESCGTRGRAPFDVVVTHGFTLDEHGRKMSKSLGNTVAPQDVIKQSGADILRLWVASCDYWEDQRIGPEILKTTVDTYRKLRNTIRWMLGNLAHFRPEDDRVAPEKMPELERLMLHRLAELDALVRKAYAEFDFKRIFAALSHFMTTDLSAFYFDIRKDALYCDPISSHDPQVRLTVLDQLFRCTVIWLAPMLCFTAEEAWCERYRVGRRVGASRTVPRGAGVLARRQSWPRNGARCARCAASSPGRWRSRAPASASAPRSRPTRSCMSPIGSCSRRWSTSIWRKSASPRRRRWSTTRARPTRSGCRRCRASPSWSIWPRAASARARGKSRHDVGGDPQYPRRHAARRARRCANGKPCARPRSDVALSSPRRRGPMRHRGRPVSAVFRLYASQPKDMARCTSV